MRGQQLGLVGDRRAVGRKRRLDRIDRETVGRDGTILDQGALGVELRLQAVGRVVIARRAGADQPEMIEEGPAEGSVVEMIGQHIAFGIGPERQLAAVVVAHGQSAAVGDRGELVHLAAVDLDLLLIIAMHQIAGELIQRGIAVGGEGLVGKVGREARIGHGRLLAGIHDRRQRGKGLAVLVHLRRGLQPIVEPVGALEQAVEIVEAAVLQIDHHDMLDLLEAGLRCHGLGGICRRGQGKRTQDRRDTQDLPVQH